MKLKGKLIADVDLQPLRWMSEGLQLIDSFHGTVHIQLRDGVQGEPLNRMLHYPVFQTGSELFLKGMWLCKFPRCRDNPAGGLRGTSKTIGDQ